MSSTTLDQPTITLVGTATVHEEFEARENRSDYAAWYTLLRVEPQTVQIVHKAGRDPNGTAFESVSITAAATVVEDYYGAHFGGVAVGGYDRTKNAGKADTFTLYSTYIRPGHGTQRLFGALARWLDSEFTYKVGNDAPHGITVELDEAEVASLGVDLAAERQAERDLDWSAFGTKAIERMEQSLGHLGYVAHHDKRVLKAMEAGEEPPTHPCHSHAPRNLDAARSQAKHTCEGVQRMIAELDAERERQAANRRAAKGGC